MRSPYCNNHKVATYGQRTAIELFEKHLLSSPLSLDDLWTLSGCRLACHCRPEQDCQGDVITLRYPSADDRNDPLSAAPKTEELQYLAKLRETPESDDGSTADENAPPTRSGWSGQGLSMMVGSGYSIREYCGGQTLASPGRWPVEFREMFVALDSTEEARTPSELIQASALHIKKEWAKLKKVWKSGQITNRRKTKSRRRSACSRRADHDAHVRLDIPHEPI